MFQENLHIFIKDFGCKLVFTLVNGRTIDKDINGNELMGIFDCSYSSPELGYMTVMNPDPVLSCVEEDVKSITKGCSCLVNNKNYKVVSNQPDGTGMAIIKLSCNDRS